MGLTVLCLSIYCWLHRKELQHPRVAHAIHTSAYLAYFTGVAIEGHGGYLTVAALTMAVVIVYNHFRTNP